MANIFCLGITGGIGSGKSEVCKNIKDLGAVIFHADSAAKELMETDLELRAKISENFGNRSYSQDGKVNTSYLSSLVFKNKESVQHINDLVHPHVVDLFLKEKVNAHSEGASLMVLEAALIFESGLNRYLDAVAVVDCSFEHRVQRATARSGLTREQILGRMRYQMDPHKAKKQADYVLSNSGSLEDLKKKSQELFREISLRIKA